MCGKERGFGLWIFAAWTVRQTLAGNFGKLLVSTWTESAVQSHSVIGLWRHNEAWHDRRVCVAISHSAVCSLCIHVLDTFLFEPWVEWKFCGQCSVRSDWLDFVVHAKSSQPDSREFYFFVRRCSSVREVWFEKGVGYSRAPRVCLRDKGFYAREICVGHWLFTGFSAVSSGLKVQAELRVVSTLGFCASSLLDGSRLFGELIVVSTLGF